MKSFHWYPTRSRPVPPAYLNEHDFSGNPLNTPNALHHPHHLEQVDDRTLAKQVKKALHHPDLHSSSLHVEASHGTVQLHGFIDSLEDIIRIINAIRPIESVTSVRLTCRMNNSIMQRWF